MASPYSAGRRKRVPKVSELQAEWMPERLDDEARERQRETCRSPERLAKVAASLRGKPRPPHVIEAQQRGNLGKKHTAETRAKMSAAHKARDMAAGSRQPVESAMGCAPRHGARQGPGSPAWRCGYHGLAPAENAGRAKPPAD